MCSNTYIGPHVKYLPFLSDFGETGIFLTDCCKIVKCQISLKIFSGIQLSVWRDGHTELKKLIVPFCNFQNAQKNVFDLLLHDGGAL